MFFFYLSNSDPNWRSDKNNIKMQRDFENVYIFDPIFFIVKWKLY